MRNYEITWVIELEALTPLLAAKHAREIQLDPESIATVFKVQQPGGALPWRSTSPTTRHRSSWSATRAAYAPASSRP